MRGEHAQVAIDAHEAIVLHEHFEATGTLLLDTDHLAGCGRQYRCATRRRQINTVVVGAREWMLWQHPRAEWRRYAGRSDRRRENWSLLRVGSCAANRGSRRSPTR